MKLIRKVRTTWMWALVVLKVMLPGTALAEGTGQAGTRVVIRVPADIAIPDAEALLTRLTPQGRREQLTVAAHKKVENGISETRLDLWGNTIPQSEMEATLRSGFPALAGAEIVVSSVDASEKPATPEECKGVRKGGKCKVVKHLEQGKERAPERAPARTP